VVIATDLLVVVFASLVSGSFSGYFIDFQVIVISPCLPIKWLMRSDVFKFVVVVLLLDGRWNMSFKLQIARPPPACVIMPSVISSQRLLQLVS
jgi:hypothetical protein